MSLTSFNSYLLTKLVRNFRLGSDPHSLMKRHQTLSIIYSNFSLILMIVFYEVTSVLLGLPYHHLPAMIVPFVILSFVCIRYKKNDIATVSVLIYAHGVNAFVSYFSFSSLGALAAVFMFPNFSFFMSSSSKVQIINMFMCIFQVLGHIRNFLKVFTVTLTTEQNDEITHLVAVAVPCLSFLCFTLIMQKSVENSVWLAAKMAQEKTEKINQEIMQAVEAKDSFISSLSHEIRNPLNAMNGSINYLLKVIKDPQSQQVLSNAKISGETLLHLFNNLLDAAKLKSDKMELSYDDTNLFETVKKVLIINCENIRSKQIFAEVFINRNIPEVIRSDSARLLQILMNLLSNSLKFTPENGKITIIATLCDKRQSRESLLAQLNEPSSNNVSSQHISSRNEEQLRQSSLDELDDSSFTDEFSLEEAKSRTENLRCLRTFEIKALDQVHHNQTDSFRGNIPWTIHRFDSNGSPEPKIDDTSIVLNNIDDNHVDYFLKIQISDSGCGIAQENIPKLFAMFTQAHNRVTSSHGGTGLGLWICKQLCQKMGGDITLYSAVGKGTSFVFYLPISNRHVVETAATEAFDVNLGSHSDKVSCLVVDDFNYNRDLYKLLLEREGVQVVVASDGEEAIKKYLGNVGKLDFIMMDVQMPKVDGFTAAKRIRELEAINKWKRVDIYFVSGEYYNEEEVMASFRTQGGGRETVGIQSLKKPIDIEAIAKVAAKYTKKGR